MKNESTKVRTHSTSYLVSNLVRVIFGLPALNPLIKVRQCIDIAELKEYIAQHNKIIKKLHSKGFNALTPNELEILKSVDYAKNLIRIKEVSGDS